jgi:UDP-GlcNAc:undecaprenyl-phosphate/decaprenyl-phosphate GlcNAc-1-phosphate transferase
MTLDALDLLGAAVFASVVSFLATAAVVWAARRLGVLDQPVGYKAHAVATPLLGGLGVAAGVVGGVTGCLPITGRVAIAGLAALAVGAAMILAAGLVDDIRGLAPRHKFAFQVAATGAAALCLAALGVHLDLFLHWPPLPIMLLTALWIVAITNAVNFLDNMDGLCAGLGAVAAGSLAVINLRSNEFTVALVAASLAGACLGFLPHNWPRARVFLGDTGSMLIGFLLAALSVMGVYTRGAQVPVLAVFTPLFVLAIPLLDSVLVVILRLRIGHPPWQGDRRHISHRLVRRGMRPTAAVAALWAAGAACGLAAVLLPTVGPTQVPLLLALLFCALGALALAAGTHGLP